MQYERDTLTIEEVLNTAPEVWEAVMDASHYDIKPGDSFFIKENPTKAFFIEGLEKGSGVTYSGGKLIGDDDIIPLFSTGTMINIMGIHNQFEVRSAGVNWIALFDGEQVYKSDEGELLVSFLWKVLKDLSVQKKLI
ncbi:hypothetical protein [Paenibacillus illinoisensis]|uniref:hypothetical protein n=1 Tax=Paenibacillus illinoisensis TaxID=59845 RepID=UPI00301D6143